MKLKIVIATAAIAMSSQAHAATDTSCNPFSRGASCGSVSLGAFSSGSSFGKFMSQHRARGKFSIGSRGSSQAGRLINGLASSTSGAVVIGGEEPDFDQVEEVVLEEVDGGDDDLGVVPVPAAGFLLLSGLGGLMVMRRKKS